MGSIALIISVFALLAAAVAVYSAFQALKLNTVDDPALKRITRLETHCLTWEEIQPHLDRHYQTKKRADSAYASKAEIKATNRKVDELSDASGNVNQGIENFVDDEEVRKIVAEAVALIPTGSVGAVTSPQSVMIEKVVRTLVESLHVVSQGLPTASRRSIEEEITSIETRGQLEMMTFQQARSDAQKQLRTAELNLIGAQRGLLPLEPTNEMAQAHVETTIPKGSYKEKLEECERYERDLYPSLQKESDQKVQQAILHVETCRETLERARIGQNEFERDLQKTPKENMRLRVLRSDLDNLDRLSACLIRANRELNSQPAPPARPARFPAPSRSLSNHTGYVHTGYVPEEEVQDVDVLDSMPPAPDSSAHITKVMKEDTRKTATMEPVTLVRGQEEENSSVYGLDNLVQQVHRPKE